MLVSELLKSRRNLVILLYFTCGLFLLSLFLPLITVSKFFVLKNTISMVSSLIDLLREGEWLLFLVIFLFSIVLPCLKLFFIYVLLNQWDKVGESTIKIIKLIHTLGRWGMLDVFVLALIIVSIKLGIFAQVKIHFGLYLFTITVLLIKFLTVAALKVCIKKSLI